MKTKEQVEDKIRLLILERAIHEKVIKGEKDNSVTYKSSVKRFDQCNKEISILRWFLR